MGFFFVKIKFNLYLMSSTIELFAKSETDRTLSLFVIAPHPQKLSLKVLLCTHMAFPYTTSDLEIK